MDYDDWRSRWHEGKIGFHLGEPHAGLREFSDRLLDEPGRVLVPLCGKAVDLRYLAERGHEVVGIEFVEKAARDFFDEQSLPCERRDGDHPVYAGGSIEIHVADVFTISNEDVGSIDAVYDRAALIALPEDQRGVYAGRLMRWLRPGGRMLLVTLAYDQARMSGPPFSVPDDDVHRLFGELCEVERLATTSDEKPPARFAEQGITVRETVWLCTKR